MAERIYAAGLRLRGKRVLVVGAGAVAARKVAGLLDARADVIVVAPTLASDELRGRVDSGNVAWESRAYESRDVAGTSLVFAATNDPVVNRAVHADAVLAGVPVNVADAPELCDFDVPSSFARDVDGRAEYDGKGARWSGALQIAVFTGGLCPAFAAFMRRELERAVQPEHVALLRLVTNLRRLLPPGLRHASARVASREALDEIARRDRVALRTRLEREVGDCLTPQGIDALLAEALS